ncbi:unnamed protein product [Dovyalis caffra]|uniref:Uncharacterized protein n=1 Tax=Dovyalis caffra TaxID=77055 RepID=A0AAV1S4K8_9ROSI|nr:unnamed protein product [Dovyalis caffra]
MHDLLRDLALIITSPRGNNDNKFLVKAGLRDGSYGNEEEWKQMKRVSFINNELGTLPESPDYIESLPSSISRLVNLRGLYPKYCYALEELPSEVGSLKKLEELQMIAIEVGGYSCWGDRKSHLIGATRKLLVLERTKSLELPIFCHADSFPVVYPQPELSHGALILYDCQDSPTTPIPPTIMRVLSRSQEFMVSSRGIKTLSEFGMQNLKGLRKCMVWSCDDIEILANGDESEGGEIFADLENLTLRCLPKLRAILEGT